MFRKSVLILFAALSLLLLPVGPVLAEGLFDVRVNVETESARERTQAAREGMREVLLRLTGRTQVVENEAVRDALIRDADRYVLQYGYDRREDEDGFSLRLRFDGVSVERRLVELEAPFWAAADRDRMLVWLVLDRAGSRDLAGGDNLLDLQEAMRDAGNTQGLGLLFPLMDLEDQRALSTSDVWGGFRGPILDASSRYGTENVLVVRVAERGGDWSIRWLNYRNGDSLEWTSSADDAEAALTSGMAEGARQMAEQLARVRRDEDRSRIRLAFADVDSLADYGYLMRLLGDSRGVEGVHVLSASEQALVLELLVDGDSGRLMRSLDDNARLRPLDGDDDGPAADRRWQLLR